MTDTFDRIRKVVADQLSLTDRDKITRESTYADLGVDSLDAVEISMATEEEFGIDLQDDELQDVSTIDDLIRLVDGKGRAGHA